MDSDNWISTKERLPDKKGFYLVQVGAPYKPVRVYEYKPYNLHESMNLWRGESGSYVCDWFVEYWMPLPKLHEDYVI